MPEEYHEVLALAIRSIHSLIKENQELKQKLRDIDNVRFVANLDHITYTKEETE